jgi:glutamate-1-semialdehyde 2,1-aminomutase
MTTRSEELFRRAVQVLPGGVSRNTLLRDPHPLYVDKASGCMTTDVEGVERIDFANNMASLIHGHGHPSIVEAVTEQLARGTAFTMATEAEVIFAHHLCNRSPNFDKLRFVNSGTEAVMAGLKAARAFTDRPKIAKIEGTYHGAYDYAEVSQSPQPSRWGDASSPTSVPLAVGTPDGVLADVIVLPFNDPEAATAILDQHRGEIACVLVDPMPHRAGLIPATEAFVRALREWTTKDGSLLMFDEVITFRTEFGGMQSRLGVRPDLTSMGKMIGGGFPVGAIAGREEVMGVFAPGGDGPRLPHSGTFSANPITMTAGYTAMNLFDRDAVTRLNELGTYARTQLGEAISITGAPASVSGAGSMYRVHMKEELPWDYRSSFPTQAEKKALTTFVNHLSDAGFLMIYSGAFTLSTPMGRADIDRLAEAAVGALRKSME